MKICSRNWNSSGIVIEHRTKYSSGTVLYSCSRTYNNYVLEMF